MQLHRRSQGGHAPKTFLENIVILCFERRFSKQNSVIRLKSNIWPPQFFSPHVFGLVTPLYNYKVDLIWILLFLQEMKSHR